MSAFVEFVVRVLGWGLVALVVHELAHGVAAVLLGRRLAGIDWRTLDVYWLVPASGADWRDRAIGVAPLFTGLLAALAAVVVPIGLSAPQWLALAFYALHGGLDDLRVSTVAPGALQGQN